MVDHKNDEDLDLLEEKIKAAQNRDAEEGPPARENDNSFGLAMRIGVELVVSVAVVTFLGYQLDGWLDSTPVGMIAGIFLGFAVGVRNIIKRANELQSKHDTDD